MEPIYISDPAWQKTFPYRVAPLPDEWLAGLVLRCDEVNDWGSGTTASLLLKETHAKHALSESSFVIPSTFSLTPLAEWLAIPEDTLYLTTYHTELARIYGTSTPQRKLLNRDFLFHFCPVCIAEEHLLRRTLTLPHLLCCPIHHIVLSHQCECGKNLTVEQLTGPGLTGGDYKFMQFLASLSTGTRQRMFSSGKHPFTCHRCGLDWGKFPRAQADPERIGLEEKILTWYEFFFSQGSRLLLAHALQLIEQQLAERNVRSIKRLDGKSVAVNFFSPEKSALARVIDVLVSLNMYPDDLEAE
jgi:TniQ